MGLETRLMSFPSRFLLSRLLQVTSFHFLPLVESLVSFSIVDTWNLLFFR